jgi:hypothetical protein
MQMDENMYTILYRFIKSMTHECILTCVYVMKTVNRNPHLNEMRLTDKFQIQLYIVLNLLFCFIHTFDFTLFHFMKFM